MVTNFERLIKCTVIPKWVSVELKRIKMLYQNGADSNCFFYEFVGYGFLNIFSVDIQGIVLGYFT